MLFSSHISNGQLAAYCRRVATMLHAGIDICTVLAREVDRARKSALRQRLIVLLKCVEQGDSLRNGLAETGDYFPILFRELVGVGEQTGQLAEVFDHLAKHYDQQIRLRRIFLGAIALPVAQLVLAIAVIGFMIWILGALNTDVDPLGFGLIGNRGLTIYLSIVGSIAVCLGLLIQAFRRGMMWTRPIQRVIFRIPWIGSNLQIVMLARMAWVMHLTLGAGMPVRRAIELALRSTQNTRYIDEIQAVDRTIAHGNPIHEAFEETEVFSTDFLDAVRVGEESGRLVESMGTLSKLYQDRATSALIALTTIAGYCVWMCVAAIIIWLIFRLAFFYLSAIGG